MCCWSSVCPHRATVNLLQPASTQCAVGPVCVPIEILSTYFNLPQPGLRLIHHVPMTSIIIFHYTIQCFIILTLSIAESSLFFTSPVPLEQNEPLNIVNLCSIPEIPEATITAVVVEEGNISYCLVETERGNFRSTDIANNGSSK